MLGARLNGCHLLRAAAAGLCAILATGCGTPSLDRARTAYRAGQYHAAASALEDKKPARQDQVLFHMERGTVRQADRQFEASTADYLAANDLIEEMVSLSVSRDSASMVINDTVQDYKGDPFERTLLHAFTAKNHLALGQWENAAVEARRILQTLQPEVLGDYPEDAYSRYLAGFCLDLMGDGSNARLQYRKANDLTPNVVIDEQTGRLASPGETPTQRQAGETELVCFVLLGNIPSDGQLRRQATTGPAGYAELYAHGQSLGRSYPLANTIDLAFTTLQKNAAKELAKTVSRIAIKEGIASSVESENEALGELIRFVLIWMLERPDTRRWETLPESLQVARVTCPPDLEAFDVVIRSPSGVAMRTVHVTAPITRNGAVFVSHMRDRQPAD